MMRVSNVQNYHLAVLVQHNALLSQMARLRSIVNRVGNNIEGSQCLKQ